MAEALVRRAIDGRPGSWLAFRPRRQAWLRFDGNRATPLACDAMREAFDVDLSAHRARLLPAMDGDLVLALDDETLRRHCSACG